MERNAENTPAVELERIKSSRRRRDPDRPPRPTIVCPSGKVAFASEAVAAEVLAEYAGSSRPNRPVRYYTHAACAGWHLTSQPPREPRSA